MLPSLARLLMRANNHQWDLPDEILDTIDELIGIDDPCNGLRKLCELRKDLCSEEVYRAACSHFRYSTEKIRDDFLNSLTLEGTSVQNAKSIVNHPWRLCFRQLCARPKLTNDTFKEATKYACKLGGTHYKYGHISFWDVSNVTNMASAFSYEETFNMNIDLWDVSNVTNMSTMFCGAYAFNQPLNWDVSNVTTMEFMFEETYAFNQTLNWDVSNVTNMEGMFFRARAFNNFNQPLDWDVSSVTEMAGMFKDAIHFNQPLDQLFARGHPTPAANKTRMFEGSAQTPPWPDWYNGA